MLQHSRNRVTECEGSREEQNTDAIDDTHLARVNYMFGGMKVAEGQKI